MIESILVPVTIVAAIGLVAGVGLSIATIIFYQPKEEKEEAVRGVLPGANCGACGFSGCDGYAKALANGEAEATLCSVGGAKTRAELSEVLGISVGDVRRTAAFVCCNGKREYTANKMDYSGTQTCYGASQIFGGPESCQYGCMGYGDCKAVCEYGAIQMVDGVALIDPDKCVSCMKCVSACPKQLIAMLPAEETAIVACANHERGGGVRKTCTVGCISCSRCVKACPQNAITMDNNLAVIDPDLCNNCRACIDVCPQHCIVEMAEMKEPVEV